MVVSHAHSRYGVARGAGTGNTRPGCMLNAVIQRVREHHPVGVHFLRDCVRVIDSDYREVLSACKNKVQLVGVDVLFQRGECRHALERANIDVVRAPRSTSGASERTCISSVSFSMSGTGYAPSTLPI